MSAPRTSPDTEPPSLPHDPAPLTRVLERVRAHIGPGAPVVVFDLDATLFDNRPRTLAIVREFAATLPASEHALASTLATLQLEHMRYLVADALELVGVTDPKVVKRVSSFWWARFFKDRYIKHDVPSPGAVAYAHACYDAGANLVYLTGRDLPGMLTGTVKKLRDEGFPYAVAGTQVILKPTVKMGDDEFKRGVLPTLARLGTPVAFFDNEPVNCNSAVELLPGAEVVWLDTQCVPNPPPLVPGVRGVRHFEVDVSPAAPVHTDAFRRRRFLNWFPLGVAYALLYMGRYNLTVAKTNLGQLMTKEDFGIIFGAGTAVYAFAFLINGPLVDRVGGRRGMLIGLAGSFAANVAMGLYLHHVLASAAPTEAPLRLVFSGLYAVNMYFQSYGAVSIVKVNAHWFHVSERGGFSGIFGTMISSGIFLAFTVNGWLLDLAEWVTPGASTAERAWVVFAVPGALLGAAWLTELLLLRDTPGQAGQQDFDTGDASSGDDDAPVPTLELFRRILTNPIILTVAFIEFCTGVVRNGVMHWFPIYAGEIWVLPRTHMLRLGEWTHLWAVGACFLAAAISGALAARASSGRRGLFATLAGLAFLAPFVQAGWGGLLMIAGVLGGNVAGWVSDLFFQSRRGPAAAGLYALLSALTLGMAFALAIPSTVVESAGESAGLQAGDEVLAIAGRDGLRAWSDVRAAVACWEPVCRNSHWDRERCECRTERGGAASASTPDAHRTIPARVRRDGQELTLALTDPKPEHRAGDLRLLDARPALPFSPFWLGALVFLMSVCVIGTHGLLSGTATMDFGGRKGAGTAVGVIDGFVYLGTALQSVCLGYLTSESWSYWPWFLLPFAVLGFLLCLRIWNAKPSGKPAH